MVIKRILQIVILTSFMLVGVPNVALALGDGTQALPGASDASNYQPTTGNPQNNVGSVSQGQDNGNSVQTPQSVDQTRLPNVVDLRVQGVTGNQNANTTRTEVSTTKTQAISTWLVFVLGGLTAGAALYAVATNATKQKDKNKPGTSRPVNETTVNKAATASTSISTKHKRSTPSKNNRKHRKGKVKKTNHKR